MIVLKAAAVAARLAQSVGNTISEEVKLPEKISGLINGRTGSDDHLNNIQIDANVKITMSRESGNYLRYMIRISCRQVKQQSM